MGRPRKSAEEHKANGTYRPNRHGPLPPPAAPPEPVEPPPAKPAGLSDDVSRKWDEVTKALAHLIRPRDAGLLLELSRWLARSDTLAGALDKRKPGAKGFGQLLTAAAITTDKLLALSQRFGLTPGDRAKLKIAPPTNQAAPTPAPKVASRTRTRNDDAIPPPNAV